VRGNSNRAILGSPPSQAPLTSPAGAILKIAAQITLSIVLID
jgi:hypothetical protein